MRLCKTDAGQECMCLRSKDRSGGLQGHKKQPDASDRVVKLKECPRCHVEHPQPEYSNAGWQGLGWCRGCRIRYVMFGRRST